MLSTNITFFFAIFIFCPIGYFYRIVLVAYVVIPAVSSAKRTYWLLLSDSSCSICCNSCGVISKADIAEKNSTSIFTPLCFQFNILNVLSSVDANSLGETVSHCLYPLFRLVCSVFCIVFPQEGLRDHINFN